MKIRNKTLNTVTKSCPICERKNIIGGGYSNRVRATKFNPTGKRKKKINLQWAQMPAGGRMKVCTRCLKANKHLTHKA